MRLRPRSKYGNIKVTMDGYTFDSKREAKRYGELKLLEKAGKIDGLVVHPVFVLQDVFKDRAEKAYRAITYEGDFQYFEFRPIYPRLCVVEDVKGVKTDVFKLKEKLFRFKYPHIDFRVIK